MRQIIAAGMGLLEEILDLAEQGVSHSEIRARMAKPDGALQKVLDAATRRKNKLEAFVKEG